MQTQAENAGAQQVSRQLAHGASAKGWNAVQAFLFRRTDAFDQEPGVFFCAETRPSSLVGLARMLIRLYGEFRRVRPKAVITFQHFGNIIAAPVARLAGVKIIIANQVSPPESITPAVRLADKMLGVLGFYSHIIVNSTATETDYAGYPSAYSRRLIRIDHGFHDKSASIAKFAARQALALPQSVRLLGCAARLHPLKQVDLAIRMLPLLPTCHLALAGQGQQREQLEALAGELNIRERVHFVGELSVKDMGAFFAAIDCFVFPSATETFGLAPAEAAQAGVPVVANDLPILRDVLAFNGEPCALFIDARDSAAFAAAVRRIFDAPDLRQSLCGAGRKMTQRFPFDAMVDAYLRLIEPGAA